jgi:hypothetical protein
MAAPEVKNYNPTWWKTWSEGVALATSTRTSMYRSRICARTRTVQHPKKLSNNYRQLTWHLETETSEEKIIWKGHIWRMCSVIIMDRGQCLCMRTIIMVLVIGESRVMSQSCWKSFMRGTKHPCALEFLPVRLRKLLSEAMGVKRCRCPLGGVSRV